ncbi:FBL11 [Symbiodinium pilosum]|uniref:FBL11 protein n=1 Tax=Symbiodinium pilosum TaxID=2952 RepID=A0A812J2G6_SYMPI|nr:FBL11 [Symbiodinium pilosum]
MDFCLEETVRPELRLYCGTRPDVTLSCNGGRKLLAHRRVLSEVSYFESLFQGNFAERGTDHVQVEEDLELFLEVVRWIYCRSATSDKDMALDLLRLAEFYGIDGLIEHAARVLASPAMGVMENSEPEDGVGHDQAEGQAEQQDSFDELPPVLEAGRADSTTGVAAVKMKDV